MTQRWDRVTEWRAAWVRDKGTQGGNPERVDKKELRGMRGLLNEGKAGGVGGVGRERGRQRVEGGKPGYQYSVEEG